MKKSWIIASGGFFALFWVFLSARRAKWVLYSLNENGKRIGTVRLCCINPGATDYELAEAIIAELVAVGWKVVHRPRPL